MNRQINFRVWNKRLKRFVAIASFSQITGANCNSGLLGVTFESNETDPATQNYEDCVVQQFTGLIDRSGKKIFEGDMIEWTHKDSRESGPVVFSPSCAAFVIDSSGRHLIDEKYGNYIPMSKYMTYSILGHIFEK